MSLPWNIDGSACYCHVPTLVMIQQELAAHETRWGPALVVLDDVSLARRYDDLRPDNDRLEPHPGSLVLPPDVLAGWRASDLLGFTQQRADAPTVAVLFNEDASSPVRGALAAASRLRLSSVLRSTGAGGAAVGDVAGNALRRLAGGCGGRSTGVAAVIGCSAHPCCVQDNPKSEGKR